MFSNLGNYIDGEFIWALFVYFSFEFPNSTFTLFFLEEVLSTKSTIRFVLLS